jgi:hypothetical protein
MGSMLSFPKIRSRLNLLHLQHSVAGVPDHGWWAGFSHTHSRRRDRKKTDLMLASMCANPGKDICP